MLEISGSTTLVGDLVVSGFSKAEILGLATVAGNLNCDERGDAFCEDPGNISGTSNCGLCPVP